MQNPIPGIKATTSTNLYLLHPDAEQAGSSAWREKRGVAVQKVPVAVQRLLHERPSTGLQQINDHRYAVSSNARLLKFFGTGDCKYKLKVTDGGSDQNPRNEEVKWGDTFDHLLSGRVMDVHVTRCAKLSPLSEAEHVNGEESAAVAASTEVPSMLAAGVPTSRAELQRNARMFGQALTNAISGSTYGGQRITSLYSHPELPEEERQSSETISPAMRIAVRAINDRWPDRSKVDKMAMAVKIVPVKEYFDMHSLSGHYQNQISRFSCRQRLGRLCCRSDYEPFGSNMTFVPCNEVPNAAELEANRICHNFIPDAKMVDGHYEQFAAVQEAVAAGARNVRHQEPPPSIELKRYYNEDSQIPSPSEVQRLATDVYHDGSEEGYAMIVGWFAQRRLEQLLKQEEKYKAALDAAKGGTIAVEATVTRIVDACAAAVTVVRIEVGLFKRSRALLRHIGSVSASGSKDDLVRRIYDMRDFIIATEEYMIDESTVYPPVVSEEERRVCSTCDMCGSSVENPLLECAAQCDQKHHHMRCAGLTYMPKDWLCAPCTASGIMVIRYILGKRIVRGRTEYKVAWVGHENEEPTWQALRGIPAGSRYLVNGYNARLRREVQQTAGPAVTAAHSYVGKEVAKDFSHGAVFVGYVTEYYSPVMDGEEMSPELFHIEYDDGDEEDMEPGELDAAMALAAQRQH